MVDYLFSTIVAQQVTFSPNVDTLTFDNVSARDVVFEVIPSTVSGGSTVTGGAATGDTLRITANGQSAILDSTALLMNTSTGIFSTSNVFFSDGSVLAVGDLTGDDTLDADANTIDFANNAALSAAFDNNNQILGLDGDDTIFAGDNTGNDIIFGGAGGDSITAGVGNNVIYGGTGLVDTTDGNDHIILGPGSNTIYANGGDDTVSYALGASSTSYTLFHGGIGGDSFTADGAAGVFGLFGGPGGDALTLTNNDANHTVFGGGDNDTINLTGSQGELFVFGGNGSADSSDGADAITMGGGNAFLYSNAGADTVVGASAFGKTANVFLGLGADVMTSQSSAGNYVITAGPEGDSVDLTNHTGDSTIFGGNGTVDSTDNADTIISGMGGSSLIYGNAGADAITVRAAANESATVFAGIGNDTITAIATSDAGRFDLYGNTDNDTFQLDFTNAQPTMSLKDYALGDNILEVTLSGGSGAANLRVTRNDSQTLLRNGNAEAIMLEGFDGNFTDQTFVASDGSELLTNFGGEAASLSGSSNNDQLIAGDNGDTLAADAGNDLLTGGAGGDTFVFSAADLTQADTVIGSLGRDTISVGTPAPITDASFRQVSETEVLLLETGDFTAANSISLGSNAANASIESVDGSGATSFNLNAEAMSRSLAIQGSGGDDSIEGSNLSDTILAGSGDDTIIGNRGSDTMDGGEGNDTFVYIERVVEGVDTIRDIDFGTASTSVDQLKFFANQNNFNLGNIDLIVDGAIINDVVSAGSAGTEVIILRDVGIPTVEIEDKLNIINFDVAANQGVINMFYDSTLQHAVVYYDSNGTLAGGHSHLISLTNLTSVADMDNVDFTDFVFT